MDIPLVLESMGIVENVSPDMSSYAAMKATWRGTMPCPDEADMNAAWVIVDASLQKEQHNAPLLAQIAEKEAEGMRAMRELSRERDFPGDLSPSEKAFARNKVRQTDMDVAALRAQMQ